MSGSVRSLNDRARAAAPVVEAPDGAAAVRAARRQHIPVTVANLTTETRQIQALPDGTMRATLNVAPVRVHGPTGWVPVDTTLVRRPDGTVAPRATTAPLVLSGGGSARPLLQLGQPGRRMALSWPGALPVPALSGDTAAYRQVLPGVDLLIRAEAAGYSERLVIRDAAAARNPALATLRYGLATDGLSVRAGGDGSLSIADRSGVVAYTSAPSRMWDATGAQPASAGLATPGAGARQAVAAVSVDQQRALVVVPDAALLRDPATKFPVTLDPDVIAAAGTGWAKTFSGHPNDSYWYGGIDGGEGKVGQCYQASGGCGGIGIARLYFQFDTGFLGDKVIYDDTHLDMTIFHSPSCTVRQHTLWRTDGPIGPTTTFNNASAASPITNFDAPAAWGGNCAGSKVLGFGVKDWLEAYGTTTFLITAADEGDQLAWRKYDTGAMNLIVHFDSLPDEPSDLHTDPPLPDPCRWCGGKPYVGDESIRLIATLTDPDTNDQVAPEWLVNTDGDEEDIADQPMEQNGATVSYDVDLTGRDGRTVRWSVQGYDGAEWGPWAEAPDAFAVDRTPVTVAPTVTGGLYQEDNRWHGGVGVPGQFTFGANGVGDVDHYLYGWQDPPTTSVDADALGGKATVSLAPPKDGPRDLLVQSVDRAGHRSPTRTFHTYVRAGNGPVAQWSFEGNTRDSAFLGDRDGTLSGGTAYAAGAVGAGLELDGVPGSAMTAPSTVRTDAGFSVSAWVRPDRLPSGVMAAVSQDGDTCSGFAMGYRGDTGKWAVWMVDAAQKNAVTVYAPGAPQANVWTQLTAVFDASARRLKLYVNGVPAGDQPLPAGFVPQNATGPLRVGQERWNGAAASPWAGRVDEVGLYDRVLSPTEAEGSVARDNVQIGHWRLDDPDGPTARNEVDGGEQLVLHGGASFTGDGGGAVGGGLRLDGTAAHAGTSGPVVRTDGSFTVGAWVKVDALAGAGAARTVVSQDGATGSGFLLQQRDTGWSFGLPQSDSGTAWAVQATSAAGTAQANTWTHVVGVYDTTAGKAYLYVNGKLAATASGTVSWNATGPFEVGRTRSAAATSEFLKGTVDEVRAYSRVLSVAEVQALVSRDSVATGTWKFDGDLKGRTAAQDGTVAGTQPDWVAGQAAMPDPKDLAVRLAGGTAINLPHSADATRSFSVSVWARPDPPGTPVADRAVVSQDGTAGRAFRLLQTAGGDWSFEMYDTDSQNSTRVAAVGAAAQPGVWTHLVAVYDAGAHQMYLYVNGVLSATGTHTQTWDAPGGALAVGRSMSKVSDRYLGAVDDLSVFSRMLFAGEIGTMAGRDLSLVDNWRLDEASGRAAYDAVGSRSLTLTGGATFAPGVLGNALSLDGVGGSAGTTGNDLATDQNFTVSTWVYLPDSAKHCDLAAHPAGCRFDAVSLDGGHTSKFRLGLLIDNDQHPDGSWFFEMPESDASDAVVTKAAVSADVSDTNRWVHLVGVYDRTAKTVWLYVDGNRIGEGTLNGTWNAGGGVQIGRGRAADSLAEYWQGKVDDARLYTGALDSDRIFQLYSSYPDPKTAAGGTVPTPAPDVAYWKLDENTGTTGADATGHAPAVTLKGGAGWAAGCRNGPCLKGNGTSGYAETSGPAVDTGRSFTVAAWAAPPPVPGTAPRTVLGQDGSQVSAFLLRYDGGSKRWQVVVPGTDTANPTSTVLSATDWPVTNEWTHLAVSYDATLHQVRLYVNGRLAAAQTGVTVRPSSGPFSIGRSRWNGANSDFFDNMIDDVKVFQQALTDSQVRRLHDDVYTYPVADWRFDAGNGTDSTLRHTDLAPTGGVSYVPGVSGKAVQLDGTSGYLSGVYSTQVAESFSVTAYAKLARDDRVATVIGQDGTVMSSWVLQYRPGLKRWVFGAASQDAEGAPMVYAASAQPAAVNTWVALTGVYDYANRQLRLYVDGQLAGTKDGVSLWRSLGSTAIGRDRYRGAAADFFPGAIDEVHLDAGLPTDTLIAQWGGWPAPPAGQLGRFVNGAGDHYTGRTDDPVRAGYHFEAALGVPARSGQANTRTLYACRTGTDGFTSTDPACEGGAVLGTAGLVYTAAPANLPSVPLYRCTAGTDRFESADQACEGRGGTGTLLGYSLGYATLYRYASTWLHWSSVDAIPPGYHAEGPHGMVALTAVAGTQALTSCADGAVQFVSLDGACEGKRVLGSAGRIWSQPPAGTASQPIYRCTGGFERFLSNQATCEGAGPGQLLGYVLAAVPADPPTFH